MIFGALSGGAGNSLDSDFAKAKAGAKHGIDGSGLAVGTDFDGVAARVLVELVEFEVAVVVGGGVGDHGAALEQPHARALDTVDHPAGLARHRTGDEALG